MTTLAITPNWKNKSAKFKGTVAAGEHVSVTIQNENGEGGEFIDDASTLRLRVVNPCNGRTLAIFPEPVPEGETPEEWDSDLSPLRCTLNLNTVQMLKAVPPAANVPLLWVLDDYDNNTLYFKEQFEVTHWPRLRGEEEPTDLDNYKDIIADFNDRLDSYDTRITGVENAAQAATENASAATATANQAVDIANQALDKAETAQNSAAASAEAAAVAQVAAEAAQAAAEEAAESINSPDATLTEAGVAADAKATGDAIALEKTRATAAEAAEETRAKGVESGLRTDLTAAQKAIDDEAILRAAADADLDANKADKATTYTKSEVDAKVAGYVNGATYDSTAKKILLKHGENTVAEIDATDFIKDGMVSSVEIADGKLVITFNTDSGLEPIEIPLTDIFDPANYYDKTAADGKFVAKEAGKGLSTEDYTTAEKTKLGGIAAGAQVNVIETVKVNGTALTPQDKAVNIPVPTLDNTVTPTSANGVKSSGIWSMLWGALTALPAGFTSLYDWCVAQLEGKVSKSGGEMTGPLYNRGEEIRPVAWSSKGGPKSGPAHSVFGPNGICYEPAYENASSGREHIAKFRSDKDGFFAFLEDIASDYSDETVYAVGQLAIVDGVLKKCTTAGTGGLAVFSATTLEDVLAALRTAITGKADVSAIPYSLGTPTVIDTASSEVVEGETVYYGAATLANRTANIVQVTAATALDELRITFPAATSGKVRDFGLRVEIGTGSAALAAPALVPVAPTGETIKIENNAAEIPALADGTATAKGVTLLYFSENSPGVFVVKGEQVEEVA